ncbi:hypothetical protein JD844_013971 [Phrynosoma platyrhinos]|uniref:Ig-like domain-containing protein n=1 Tax=Phrynosoma platyrhinos TaxID=52577 RepID=A0ABQ7TMV6_PHRPL|nr:hypothetical protein JD844_013971 [Phrynosoma platyrhinos]
MRASWTYGCDLSEEGRKGAYDKLAYDGEEVMSFDLEILQWRAGFDAKSQAIKRMWDADAAYSKYQKAYLEEECIVLLRKYLDYEKETLRRKETPEVKVLVRKMDFESLETLVCRIHGFYPRGINASWRKDGTVWEQGTFWAGVFPNSDGTYHTWLSIMIDSKERDRFRCHIEHDGLLTPLDMAWEAPVGKCPVGEKRLEEGLATVQELMAPPDLN